MKQELKEKLYAEFPALFGCMEGRPVNTSIGVGWFNLMHSVCEKLWALGDPNIRILQVKEKFATLTIYVNIYNDDVRSILSEAIKESEKICERCGSREGIEQAGKYWLKTLCGNCRAEDKKNNK